MKNRLTILSLFILLITATQVSLAANATIVSWGNNVTNNDDLSIDVEQLSSVTFNVTANQTISDWHWSNATIISGDGTVASNATRHFTEALTYHVTVYGNNTNGTTSLKTWTVTVASIPTYSISGYVLNASGAPINGAAVINTTIGSNTTDANGYYIISGAPNGTWRITATANSYISNYTDTTVNGANLVNKNITLQQTPAITYSISGYVLNASGSPISGAIVSNPTLSFNTTDANGYYILSGATNGIWRITATATGYTGNYVDANVTGGNKVNQNITLQPVTPGPSHPGALKIVWFSPGAVDYAFVNETVSETITYTVATNQPTTNDSWYLDYSAVPASGQAYIKTWNNLSVGNHVIKYVGKNANGTVTFEWYINVYYEAALPSEKKGILQIIDDALANHVYDIKIRMFKHRCDVAPNASERAKFVKERNQLLHDEIAKRQMIREALRKEFKAGNITEKTYVTAMHTAQSEMKNAVKGQHDLEKYEKKFEHDDDDRHDLKKIEKNNNGKNWKNGHSSDDREEDEGDD